MTLDPIIFGQIPTNSPLDDQLLLGEWGNWTPAYTGFSVDPVGVVARFLIIRQVVFAHVFMSMPGTSNAKFFTITMPFVAAAAASGETWGCLSAHIDNGKVGDAPGLITLAPGAIVADLYPDSKKSDWKMMGDKAANFTLIYEIPEP